MRTMARPPPASYHPLMRIFAVAPLLLALACPSTKTETGAPADSGDIGGSTYHPAGWSDPGNHGFAAKFQEDACLDCHGADLDGGSAGVSCSACHDAGWETDCTFCHGGEDGESDGAPPQNLDDSTSGGTFAEHRAHTDGTSLHDAFACSQCHETHSTALETSHILDAADPTPGTAELAFTAGLSAKGSYDGAGGCSNLYCHGNGEGDNGNMASGSTIAGCDDCHASSGLSGEHGEHLREGVGCDDCHGETASSNSAIKDPTLHVNGSMDLALPSEITYDGNTCFGDCHGEWHVYEGW